MKTFDLCRVCNGLCKGLCKAKAPPLLGCAGCAGLMRARVRVTKFIIKNINIISRVINTPAHPAHPAHACIDVVCRQAHPCTDPCTPLHTLTLYVYH